MFKLNALLLLSTLALLNKTQRVIGRSAPIPAAEAAENVLSDLGNIFKVGPGMMVFNNGPSSFIIDKSLKNNEGGDDDDDDVDKINCAERNAGKSYCTEVPNYLEATQLDKIDPDQFEQFKSYFKDDFVPPQNVTNRMNDQREEYFCNSKSRIIYPKSVESRESKWVLVVQHAQHRQGVLVEQCENEERPCKYDNLLPLRISSRCKQHYVYRSLVVLVNGVLKEDMVKLPNYCECVLRFNLRF
ncbi:protein spaetzle-like [Rhagoletis pomonella]|uniref:protein spaetzle-like n=1 Tax=Rhagoletis pomonella TaxID=28610 RepID=UPI0017809A8C|nr:protein spaetzle-like [Rhagoletis pomonella]